MLNNLPRQEPKLKTVGYENNDKKMDSVYSKRIKAGKRRTYFFDVRSTRGNDYYLTITESRKRFTGEGYDRHKIFLYKEDFNKFIKGLNEAVDYVKTELMPDFDFDAFNHDEEFAGGEGEADYAPESSYEAPVAENNEAPAAEEPASAPAEETPSSDNGSNEEVEKW